jgi:hypothetical protein
MFATTTNYRTAEFLRAVDDLLTKNEYFWGKVVVQIPGPIVSGNGPCEYATDGQLFHFRALNGLPPQIEDGKIVGVVIQKPHTMGGVSVFLRKTSFSNVWEVFVYEHYTDKVDMFDCRKKVYPCFVGSKGFSEENLKPTIDNPYYLGVWTIGGIDTPYFYDIITLEEQWR